MVFKNKLFFSSSKKSDSSSADGSNSPRSTSNSPIRADKKKAKASTSKLDSKQKSWQQNVESCSGAGNNVSSRGHSGSLKSSDFCTPEISYYCENPKGSESPRSQAILRATSGPRKRGPADIKSFSHELNSKGETLVVIRAKFDKAKEEVNSDLAFFAADVVGLLDKNAESHPEWQEAIEELLVLARSCAMTPPGEFWFQCEGIVQELDDRRQELPPCVLKQLYTRMPFILTRCTRLLKFHRECGLAEDENLIQLRQFLI